MTDRKWYWIVERRELYGDGKKAWHKIGRAETAPEYAHDRVAALYRVAASPAIEYRVRKVTRA